MYFDLPLTVEALWSPVSGFSEFVVRALFPYLHTIIDGLLFSTAQLPVNNIDIAYLLVLAFLAVSKLASCMGL